MRVLVTGGNGSCAYYLKDELKGNEIHEITRPHCDLLDFAGVVENLRSAQPDVIFHLAADADVRRSFDLPAPCIRNNTEGTVNIFEACRKLKIRPVIQICSSSEVYGNPGPKPITEDFPISPINPYAVSKAAQDLLGGMYERYEFKVVRTRAFGYVNPRRSGIALTAFANRIVEIERGASTVMRHGNLDSVRTFCDVRDIARAYILATEETGVFNIGSEEPVSIGECLEILCGFAKKKVRLKLDKKLLRPTDVTHQIPDCSKFRKATGWTPQIPLKDSLRWLLACCRLRT